MGRTTSEVLNRVHTDLTPATSAFRITGSVTSGGIDQQLTTSQDLAVGELDYTTSVGSTFLVNGIFFTFSATTTQDIWIEYNGSEIFKQTANSVNDAYINTKGLKVLGSLGKELTIRCGNTGSPAIIVDVTVDIEVV